MIICTTNRMLWDGILCNSKYEICFLPTKRLLYNEHIPIRNFINFDRVGNWEYIYPSLRSVIFFFIRLSLHYKNNQHKFRNCIFQNLNYIFNKLPLWNEFSSLSCLPIYHLQCEYKHKACLFLIFSIRNLF